MDKHKTIIRKAKNRNNPYVMINKSVLEDANVSFKAKGIMSYILGKPDDWKIMIVDLIKKAKDGRDSVYSGLAELKKHGYIQEIAYRENNRIVAREYVVYESPELNPYPPEKWGKVVHVKVDRELDTENPDQGLDTENPDKGVLNPEKPDQGKADQGNHDQAKPTLLNNDSTNNDSTDNDLTNNGDDKEEPAPQEVKPWEADQGYQQIRQMVVANGETITSDEKVYEKYLEALKECDQPTLLIALMEYIKQVVTGEHDHDFPRIAWFLGRGWRNFVNRKKEQPKKTQRKQKHVEEELPYAIRLQMEREKLKRQGQQQPSDSEEKDKESLAEKRVRINQKLQAMRKRLAEKNKPSWAN